MLRASVCMAGVTYILRLQKHGTLEKRQTNTSKGDLYVMNQSFAWEEKIYKRRPESSWNFESIDKEATVMML